MAMPRFRLRSSLKAWGLSQEREIWGVKAGLMAVVPGNLEQIRVLMQAGQMADRKAPPKARGFAGCQGDAGPAGR